MVMKLYGRTDEFVALYGDDVLQEVVEAALVGGSDRVTITDTVQHDVANHTFYGRLMLDGQETMFVIESGSRAGTVIRDFGEDIDLTPPGGRYTRYFAPKPLRLQPAPGESLEEFTIRHDAAIARRDAIFAQLRVRPEFQEKERAMNYDMHFEPTDKTRRHYTAWAAMRGLAIEGKWVEPDEDAG